MSYAKRNDGLGFRAVSSAADCTAEETFSATLPVLGSASTDVVVVTMRQARLALLAAGKLDAVAAAIAALPLPQSAAAQIEWDFASEVRKDSPLIATLAPAIGLSNEDLTALFNAAGLL